MGQCGERLYFCNVGHKSVSISQLFFWTSLELRLLYIPRDKTNEIERMAVAAIDVHPADTASISSTVARASLYVVIVVRDVPNGDVNWWHALSLLPVGYAQDTTGMPPSDNV